jgi:hypothetical protein
MPLISTLKTTAVAVGTVGGLWLVGATFAPEATANVVSTLNDRIGSFVAPDCTSQPADCLRVRERELAALAETLAALRVRLDGEQTRSAELAIDAEQRLAANSLYLAEGRRILLAGLPGQPLTFLGVGYPAPDALRQQLELTFAEGRQLEALVTQYRTIRDEIGTARRDIVTHRAEVIAELRIIPSKIALAEVQAASGELRAALAQIDGVMEGARNASRAADPLLRSTDELMLDATRPPTTPSAFDAWLRGPNGG